MLSAWLHTYDAPLQGQRSAARTRCEGHQQRSARPGSSLATRSQTRCSPSNRGPEVHRGLTRKAVNQPRAIRPRISLAMRSQTRQLTDHAGVHGPEPARANRGRVDSCWHAGQHPLLIPQRCLQLQPLALHLHLHPARRPQHVEGELRGQKAMVVGWLASWQVSQCSAMLQVHGSDGLLGHTRAGWHGTLEHHL